MLLRMSGARPVLEGRAPEAEAELRVAGLPGRRLPGAAFQTTCLIAVIVIVGTLLLLYYYY